MPRLHCYKSSTRVKSGSPYCFNIYYLAKHIKYNYYCFISSNFRIQCDLRNRLFASTGFKCLNYSMPTVLSVYFSFYYRNVKLGASPFINFIFSRNNESIVQNSKGKSTLVSYREKCGHLNFAIAIMSLMSLGKVTSPNQ